VPDKPAQRTKFFAVGDKIELVIKVLVGVGGGGGGNGGSGLILNTKPRIFRL